MSEVLAQLNLSDWQHLNLRSWRALELSPRAAIANRLSEWCAYGDVGQPLDNQRMTAFRFVSALFKGEERGDWEFGRRCITQLCANETAKPFVNILAGLDGHAIQKQASRLMALDQNVHSVADLDDARKVIAGLRVANGLVRAGMHEDVLQLQLVRHVMRCTDNLLEEVRNKAFLVKHSLFDRYPEFMSPVNSTLYERLKDIAYEKPPTPPTRPTTPAAIPVRFRLVS